MRLPLLPRNLSRQAGALGLAARGLLGAMLVAAMLGGSVAHAAPVTLKTADGVALKADANGAGTTAVILLHGEGRTRADWASVGADMVRSGMLVVAVDLRGHGESPLAGGAALDDAGWAKMSADVQAAVAWARAKGATTVSLVGVDVTGIVALQVAVADPKIASVTLVSPRVSGHGIKISEVLPTYKDRPILFVAGSTDTIGVRTVAALETNTVAPYLASIVDGGTTGPGLFARDPDAGGLLVAWVRSAGKVDANGAPTTLTTGSGQPTAGASGTVETTGTRIGEQPKP
jgi:pimeloyl-ACP methyl ester carboxylesterase